MDPPPIPLPTTPTTTAATAIHLNYPDSVESSPRANYENEHQPLHLQPIPGGPKLRLMCSYGGHIIPRPHDKSLCYVGGETRLIVVDRHSTLSSLITRISRSLLNGRAFTLKYQLPNEELDSLVSITTDEDLENMIDEYDRLTSSSSASSSSTNSRIRLFIFFHKPETVASMGSLLDDAKSESWFVDALNGSGLLPRGDSDTAVNCLLNLDNDSELKSSNDNQVKQTEVDDSPSFGSSSSCQNMSNLPPIRVRVDEQSRSSNVVEEQLNVGSGPGLGLPPPVPHHLGDQGRILSDDERSDHGGVNVNRLRKPPLPLPLLPLQQNKASAVYNLPSPDSVKSDSSIASGSSISKPIYYQEQVTAPNGGGSTPAPAQTPTSENLPPIPTPQIQDPAAALHTNANHQQYMHTTMNYIPHQPTTPVQVPIPSYYHPPIYTAPHKVEQNYPLYVMPVPQTQQYMSMHSNAHDPSTVIASGPAPPVIPASAAQQDKLVVEMPAGVYRAGAATTTAVNVNHPQLIQIPGGQYVPAGYTQLQHPGQAVAASSGGYYGYSEYGNSNVHDQVYYNSSTQQHQTVAVPLSQYQTMTPAAVAALTDASKQLPVDNAAQMRTSQPM